MLAMEFLLLAFFFGACVRVGQSHDRRDQLTLLMLERLAERGPLDVDMFQGFRSRFFQNKFGLAHWGREMIMESLDAIGLSYEAFPLERQWHCLRRCLSRRWVHWEFVPDFEPTPCTLTITDDGREEIRLLRQKRIQLPAPPVVRLLTR